MEQLTNNSQADGNVERQALRTLYFCGKEVHSRRLPFVITVAHLRISAATFMRGNHFLQPSSTPELDDCRNALHRYDRCSSSINPVRIVAHDGHRHTAGCQSYRGSYNCE